MVDAPGDNLLAEFSTATDAVLAATEIQRAIGARNAAVPEGRKMEFRIGVHLGEARVEGDRLYGDAVNVAARLEGLAEPGGICISADVLHQVQRKLELDFEDIGEQQVKNIPDPVRVYRVLERTAAPSRPPARRFAPRVVAAFIGAALIAMAAAAYLSLGSRSPTSDGAPLTSIAVLPFDDMSPGGDQKWLADGMAEELIETLSRIEALRVPARTSAFALRGKDIRTVGAELRVGSVVEGSVRRSDDQLRITAQLIRVSDGYHLWSARYDRKLSDVFAIQSEIARAIAEAIRGELGIEYDYSWLRNVQEPSDVRAYELVKKGVDAIFPRFTEEGLRKGIEYTEQALAIDPDYAQAHAQLSNAHYWLWENLRREADLATSRAEAERALAIDETNGLANNLLSTILYRQYEWEEARRVVDRGLSHNPSDGTLRLTSAILLDQQGRTPEALIEARRAVDFDPRYTIPHAILGLTQIYGGEYSSAVEELERAWEIAPGFGSLRQHLAYAYHLAGRDEDALEAAVRALPPDLAGREAATRQGFEKGGFLGMVRAGVEWRVASGGDACITVWAEGACELALLGDADALFECLQKAIDQRDLVFLKANPLYDPYRADPRFAALLRRMNLSE